VHPIGHPEGGPLSLSLAGNEVIDHDLFRGPRGVRRLHYKANTKEGSSGSPVFGESGQVVAVHRAMAKQPIAGTSVQHIPTYAANEGIGIGCIISWFQGR
jgi:endonuclease G